MGNKQIVISVSDQFLLANEVKELMNKIMDTITLSIKDPDEKEYVKRAVNAVIQESNLTVISAGDLKKAIPIRNVTEIQ